jgi:hypothetical protein
MNTSFTESTDSKNKVKLESSLLYVLWNCSAVHAGADAEFEVRTALVGNGASVKAKAKSSSGKTIGTVDGTIIGNRWIGKVPISDKADPAGDAIVEVKLSKHGLDGESNSVPIRQAIRIKAFKWDKTEVRRGDVVKITAEFESGVENGDEVLVKIYEYNPDGIHDPVASIPVVIANKKIDTNWKFEYPCSTNQIPTHSDLIPYNKRYVNPQFFFMVLVDGILVGKKQESGKLLFKDDLHFTLKDKEGVPIQNKTVRLAFADGSTQNAASDSNGIVKIEKKCPGSVQIRIENTKLTLENRIKLMPPPQTGV